MVSIPFACWSLLHYFKFNTVTSNEWYQYPSPVDRCLNTVTAFAMWVFTKAVVKELQPGKISIVLPSTWMGQKASIPTAVTHTTSDMQLIFNVQSTAVSPGWNAALDSALLTSEISVWLWCTQSCCCCGMMMWTRTRELGAQPWLSHGRSAQAATTWHCHGAGPPHCSYLPLNPSKQSTIIPWIPQNNELSAPESLRTINYCPIKSL